VCACIRALAVWHEKRMRRWPVCIYHIFLHYLTNGRIFRKIVIEREMHVLILSSIFV